MKAIIIDDEQNSIDSLSIMLEKYTDIDIVNTYNNSVEATKTLAYDEADILFLDIEMPHINGFELLSIFPTMPWNVIFTTAYSDYAIKAFKVNAIDYLMKPILKEDLLNAIKKVKNHIKNGVMKIDSNLLMSKFQYKISKLALPTISGLEMITIDDISYLEAQSNYCIIHMIHNKKHTVSKTLKLFENRLAQYNFIRVHNSYIINPNHISRYIKGDGGYLIMDNNTNIPVSRSKKEALLNIINEL